ncbi:MAG TPA: FAD-dependent monooxygenase [Lacunisphaera sp.]
MRKIEIVGGGLAGLSLGLALRRAGVAVTIFENGTYPRHRVCGEFITGLATSTIESLGLAPLLSDALSHGEMAWFNRSEPPRIHRLPSPALGLSRFTLDARLADAFTAGGGELKTSTRITDLAPRAGRIVATGRRPGKSPWLGLKIHVHGLDLLRPLEFHLGDHAYVGLAQVENGAVNVCGLFKRRRLSAHGIDLICAYLNATGLTDLAEKFRYAKPDVDSFCSVAAVDFDRQVPRQTGVSLGDHCAMTPPFTGNGMAMAFQSAEIALVPLIAYARSETNWNETCAAIYHAQARLFRLRLASAHLVHPYLLRPSRQRWLAALDRAHLLPFRQLYSALH